jgi:hypothetical protein
MPSLCGSAEATRKWFRAFTAHSFLACRPLRPRGVRHQYPELRCRYCLRRMTSGSALPTLPQSVPHGRSISWLHWFASATACQVARPPVRIRLDRQPSGTFTSRLSTDRSPSPLLDITTTATGLLCWRDSHPLEWQLASLHGHFRPNRAFRAMSGLPLLATEGRTIRSGCPPYQFWNRRSEPSFTLSRVQIGSIPKAIEFFLDTPADIPCARSKLVETIEVGGAPGWR